MKYFKDLAITPLTGAQVILDIDGTLLRDGDTRVGKDEEIQLRKLSQIADVYLFSNGARDRSAMLAKEYGVSYIDSIRKKPNKKVATSLPFSQKRVVIGDKVLTDGFFALFTGSSFIQVERLTQTNQALFTHFVDTLDNLLSPIIRPLMPLLHYIRMLRPEQWIKNLLVFAPLFFAGELFDVGLLGNASMAFIVFCLVSSAVYIINDVVDTETDAKHPIKRFRSLPSGSVSVFGALAFAGVLLLFAFAVLSSITALIPYLTFYFLANGIYSLFLKHVAVLDIVIVASFYVLRVLVGGVSTSVFVSLWLLLATFFLALFLVTGKRRAELLHAHKRKVLEGYAKETLDYFLISAALLSIVTYSTWVILTHPSIIAVVSVMVAVAAIFRAINVLFLHPSEGESPETIFLKDRWLFVCALAWGLLMVMTFYGV